MLKLMLHHTHTQIVCIVCFVLNVVVSTQQSLYRVTCAQFICLSFFLLLSSFVLFFLFGALHSSFSFVALFSPSFTLHKQPSKWEKKEKTRTKKKFDEQQQNCNQRENFLFVQSYGFVTLNEKVFDSAASDVLLSKQIKWNFVKFNKMKFLLRYLFAFLFVLPLFRSWYCCWCSIGCCLVSLLATQSTADWIQFYIMRYKDRNTKYIFSKWQNYAS